MDAEVADLIPAAGLEAVTRASAKIIDDVSKLSLQQMRGRRDTDGTGPVTGVATSSPRVQPADPGLTGARSEGYLSSISRRRGSEAQPGFRLLQPARRS